jgi:hypothetical protein
MDFLAQCREILLKAETAVKPDSLEQLHVWKEMIVVYNCILNQWDRMKRQNGKEFKFSKNETLDKYAKIREAVITHWFSGTKRHAVLMDDLKREIACLNCSLPLPEKFKNVSPDDIIDFPWTKLPSWAVKDDPDAAGKKAVLYKVIPKPDHDEANPVFGIYDRAEKRSGPSLKIKNIPADEKYHIYKLGTFVLGRDTIIWGHWSWWMGCAYLAPAYVNADGMKNNPNEWDVYISVKATGPLYVPGSTKENALWCDRIILAKPGSKVLTQ